MFLKMLKPNDVEIQNMFCELQIKEEKHLFILFNKTPMLNGFGRPWRMVCIGNFQMHLSVYDSHAKQKSH